MSSAALAEAEALHERVRRFARAALSGANPEEGFATLALAIAGFQARHVPVVARLSGGVPPEELARVPAVAADVFRLARVAAHPPEQDSARFSTSGTTGGAGVHAFRTLTTYRELSVAWGRRALLEAGMGVAPGRSVTVLALAPPFEPERRSSLGFMLQAFIESFDGRALGEPADSPDVTRGHWLLGPDGIDIAALEAGVAAAERRKEPVLLLATAFALVWLLEALAERRLPLPPGSALMYTGGFKGKSRELALSQLGPAVCRALHLPPERMLAEYGMTELSSQLYDRGLHRAVAGERSIFVEPPWLSLSVVDPVSREPLPDGDVGLARFTDLGNVDSALVVLTQDRVRRVPDGIELFGRQAGAPARGCSLAIEAMRAEQG